MKGKNGTLGSRIKELRLRNKMTQKKLADALYVSDKTISKWEKDNSEPELDILVDISEIFHTTIDYLVTGKTHSKGENMIIYRDDGELDHYIGLDGDRLFTRDEVSTILKKRITRHDNKLADLLGFNSIDEVIQYFFDKASGKHNPFDA